MNTFRSRRAKSENGYDILPPETLGSKSARKTLSRGVVEDAEFVTVKENIRAAPRDRDVRRAPSGFHNDNATRPTQRHQQGANPTPAKPREPLFTRLIQRIEQRLMRMSADFFSAVVAFIFVMVFGLSGGFSLIAAEPAQRSANLDITNVSLTSHDSGGMQVLQIHGIIENRGSRSQKVQPIRADLFVGDKVVYSTMIEPPAPEIAERQSRGFSARIPHPGGKNPQLKLSFIQSGATGS